MLSGSKIDIRKPWICTSVLKWSLKSHTDLAILRMSFKIYAVDMQLNNVSLCLYYIACTLFWKKYRMATVVTNIGHIHLDLGQFEQALRSYLFVKSVRVQVRFFSMLWFSISLSFIPSFDVFPPLRFLESWTISLFIFLLPSSSLFLSLSLFSLSFFFFFTICKGVWTCERQFAPISSWCIFSISTVLLYVFTQGFSFNDLKPVAFYWTSTFIINRNRLSWCADCYFCESSAHIVVHRFSAWSYFSRSLPPRFYFHYIYMM